MRKNYCFVILAAAAALFILSTQATAYTVSGYVNNPGKYSTTGSLWDVLQGPDAVSFPNTAPYEYPCYNETTVPCITLPNPAYDLNNTNHNMVDSNYVVVTGEDGSRALYSVGELDPKFAPASSEVTLTCDKHGRCDVAGEGRAVHHVSNIDVVHAVTTVHLNGTVNGVSFPFTHFYSPLIVVSGEGITPRTYNLADLRAMKQETFNASSSTTNTQGIWAGPTLASLLEASGVDTKDMDSYIIVQATDSYAAVLSMYEATQNPSGSYALLAISGFQLDSTTGNFDKQTINNCECSTDSDNGFARLILPNDTVAGRWVSNVAQIVVYKHKREFCWRNF